MVDMATSATSWFGLVEADRAGQTVPNDIGYDAAGHPSTDPAAIYKGGAIRVFDRCRTQYLALLWCDWASSKLPGCSCHDYFLINS